MARASGEPQPVVSAYERGRRQPSVAALARLVRAAGLEPVVVPGRRPVTGAARASPVAVLAVLAVLASCGGGHRPVTGAGVPAPVPTSVVPTSAVAAPTTRVTTTTGPVFRGTAAGLDPAVRARMTGVSWRPGCPVGLDDLRLLTVDYWGFDGVVHQGQLVANADAVAPLLGAFQTLFAAHFPIRQMRLVDDFGADDERSMTADNTSAFNCRFVAGRPGVWSQHAYGRAVDVDPLENPLVDGARVDPPAGAPWAGRSGPGPAVIRHGDAAWRAFAAVGWSWGGDWAAPKDYQHFSATGR